MGRGTGAVSTSTNLGGSRSAPSNVAHRRAMKASPERIVGMPGPADTVRGEGLPLIRQEDVLSCQDHPAVLTVEWVPVPDRAGG